MVALAGDRMTIRQEGGDTVFAFDNKGTGRACGGCTACCKLVPVPTLGKDAGQKCQYQSHSKGCKIYPDRPFACKTWSCRWLSDPETAGMSRPDRAHYVIDVMPDFVNMRNNDTGEVIKVPCIQVWADPAYRDAYKSREMRDYMLRTSIDQGVGFIVRWGRADAIVVFPPAICADGEWHEHRSEIVLRDADDVADAAMIGDSHKFKPATL